jgi:predicted HD phosphohydrolase
MSETNMPKVELSLEQQFNVRSFETQVDKMSLEQAQGFLKDLYRQTIVRDKLYQELLKEKWNLDSSPFFIKDKN